MDRKLNWLGLAMLVIAVISVWGAWIPAKAVALRVNAFDFAEWSSVLGQVRSGELRWFPEMLRIAIVLCGIAVALKAGDIRNRWVRWLIRGLALLPAIVVVPQFPFWLQDGYRVRFGIAVVGLIGIGLSALADRYERVRSGLIIAVSVIAVALAIWGFVVLSGPFRAFYGGALSAGWGLIAFAIMLIGAAMLEGWRWWRGSPQMRIAEA